MCSKFLLGNFPSISFPRGISRVSGSTNEKKTHTQKNIAVHTLQGSYLFSFPVLDIEFLMR